MILGDATDGMPVLVPPRVQLSACLSYVNPSKCGPSRVKKVVVFVAAAFLCGNISHLTTFRSVHPAFTGAQMLLGDLLIQ